SVERAIKQAPDWGTTFYQELRRLVVHGCLHLAGYDHAHDKQRKIMRSKEEFYLAE
ncbi:rRNA maturation RNase YbeY, partial [Fibrobacterota bacterium]